MDFEGLPDEIILEICRYLSSSDILYSFFDLNVRLNRTISIYCRHVILRQISFIQFEYICVNILPKIGSKIRSLSINANWADLLTKQFYFYFGHQMKDVFSNIEHLILTAFSGNELNDYIASISDLPSLTKLTIHDRYNVTEEYKKSLFNKILSANQNRLKQIYFNRHSESLHINPTNLEIYSNVIELSIHLDTLTDLRLLLEFLPNLNKLTVVINEESDDDKKTEFDQTILIRNLIEFHMESSRRFWIFHELDCLVKQMPCLQILSLDLLSADIRLLNGDELSCLLPIDTLQNFHYAVRYGSRDRNHSVDNIISSWSSTPYTVNCLVEDKQIYLFLYTNPYYFSYFGINSLFSKHMKNTTNDYKSSVKELLLFNVSTIDETFITIKNCPYVKDIELDMNTKTSSIIDTTTKSKSNISLPSLYNLRWLLINGCASDGYLIKEIFLVSPNLRMLIIDMKFLLELIDLKDDYSCLTLFDQRIKHLSIKISNDIEITETNMQRLSKIFTRLRHLIVERKIDDDLSIENLLLLVLNHFKQHSLISIIVRGRTNEQLRHNPCQWLIDHTYLKESLHQFKAECDNIEFKIWL